MYSNFKINTKEVEIDSVATISIDVKNTGTCSGDEIVQLYINDEAASVTRPVKELKGFARVSLKPGETKAVAFALSPKQLGFYDRSISFVVEPGCINVMIGGSSEDIRASGSFNIVGERREITKDKVFFSSVRIE